MLVDEFPEAQAVGQRGRHEETRIGYQAIVVEGRVSSRSRLCDDRINRVLLYWA